VGLGHWLGPPRRGKNGAGLRTGRAEGAGTEVWGLVHREVGRQEVLVRVKKKRERDVDGEIPRKRARRRCPALGRAKQRLCLFARHDRMTRDAVLM